LKIDSQPLEDHQVKLTVEVDPQPFESAKQRAARKLARQVKIPGFRPGKAPYPVIVRHIGEPAIIEEAVDILITDIYPEVIKGADIHPYGPGSLENIVKLDPPTFEFVIPLRAEVTLGDYHSIRMPYELEEIKPEQVDEVVKNLQERQAVIEPVDRSAQEGDLVRIQLRADRVEPAEGQPAALINDRPLPVVISAEGSDGPSAWPFPGFSRRLIGAVAGQQLDFTYTYTEDTDMDNLRGVEAHFYMTVEQVNSRVVPALDDEFAKSVGDYANMDELREAIRQNLVKHAQDEYNAEYDDKVIQQVIERSTIKYPPQMLDQEVETVIHRLENNLAQQRLDLDLYLKTRQLDMDGLKEEAKPVAEERLKRSLTLMEIAEAEKIVVKPDELESETNRTLGELSYMMQEKDFRSMLRDTGSRTNLVSNIMVDMLISRTQERLRDIARGIEIVSEPDSAEEGEPGVEPDVPDSTPVDLEASVETTAEAAAAESTEPAEPAAADEG